MAKKGSVRLSIYSTYSNKGTKQAENAMKKFARQYGKVDKATGKLTLDKTTQRLAEQSIAADFAAKKWSGYASTLTSAGTTMTAAATLPIVGIAAAAKKSYDAVRSGADNAIKATGAVGAQAEKMEESFKVVAGRVKGSFDEIGSAVGEVNTRFGFTGEQLENASTDFLKFAEVTGIDAVTAVQKVSRYMGDAGIDASNYREVLDQLTAASQASGIKVDSLAESLTKYGAPMRALGFDTEESIAIFSQWEKAGVNTETAFSGMKKAIGNWTAEGKDAKQEFKKMIKGVQDGSITGQEAMKAFGTKAGPDLIDAIQGGRFAYEDMLKVVGDSKGALDNTFDPLMDSTYKADLAMQNAQIALSDVGKTLMDALVPAIEDGTKMIKQFGEWWKSLDDDQKKAIISIAGVVAAIGPLLLIGGKLAGTISTSIRMYGKLTAQLAKFSTGSKVASVAAKTLNTAVRGLAAGVAIFAAVEVVGQVAKFTNSLSDSHKAAEKSVSSLGKVGDGMRSFGDKLSQAKSLIGDVNDTLTASGSTVGEVSGEIKSHEDAITAIISTALAEQRQLRQDELDEIKEHNEKIAELEGQKVEAYKTGLQGLADSAEAQETITADNAATLIKTAEDYHAKSIEDLDKYHADRLQALNQQFSVEGSMTEGEYKDAIAKENDYYNASKKGMDQAADDAKTAVIKHTDAIAQLPQDAIKTIEESRKKLDGLWRAFDLAYLNSDVGSVEAATKKMADSLTMLATDGNSAFLGLQLGLAKSSGEITTGNSQMIETLLSQFDHLPPEIGDSADKAMQALAKGLDDQLGIDVANSTAQEIIDAYRSKIGKAKVVGDDTGKAFVAGLSSQTQAAVDEAAKASGMTIDEFAKAADGAGLKGDKTIRAFAGALANGKDVVEAAAIANSKATVLGLDSGDSEASGSGKGKDYAAGLFSTVKLTEDQAKLVAASGVNGLGSVDYKPVGSAKGAQYCGGLDSQKYNVYASGVGTSEAARDGANSIDGSGPGENFARGFVNALGGWVGRAAEAAAGLADEAVRAINRAQDAHSPSRKTAQSAEWFALGFVNRLKEYAPTARAAGSSLMAAALDGTNSMPASYSIPTVATRAQVTSALSYSARADAADRAQPVVVDCKVDNQLTPADVYDAMVAAMSSGKLNVALYIGERELTNVMAAPIGSKLGKIERRRADGL